MSTLAVIIPAYKDKYFERALACLANQTCKDFTVYIGDDCSPNDLKSISDKFRSDLDIRYTKFENNIGSKDLVHQWKRCVGLSKDEKWIWLFSDDDIADTTCVENFYSVIEKNAERFDVYRFNTGIIDGDDNFLGYMPESPFEESSEEMAYNLLLGKRGNSMPDHIFSRNVYEKNGGFVFTQYAQAADWATSILFSKEKGICIIPHSKLFWRQSSSNISSVAPKQKNQMLEGHLQFINWLLKHFEYLEKTNSKITYKMILESARVNLKNVIIIHYKGYNYSQILQLVRFMRSRLSLSYFLIFMYLLAIKKDTNNSLRRLHQFIVGLKT